MTNEREIFGKGPYTGGNHQQFVDRTGQLVRIVRGSSQPVPVGEAYAFFDCGASKEEIERKIPVIRNLSQTPSELELYLTERIDSLEGNTELRQIADEAKKSGIRYMIKANYPTATNRQTADEVADILNQVYHSPLYNKGELFRGSVFYKEGGEYISRD
jgi:hypothetical protein